MLNLAVDSPEGFAAATAMLGAPVPKLLLIALIAAVLYHLFAGVKHMFMDFHLGDSFEAARTSSLIVFVLTAVATVLVGVRLW